MGAASTASNESIRTWLEQWVYGTGVAMFRVGWTWNRKQNEVELVLEQEVPPWRGNEGESNQAEGGAQSMFVGSIVVSHVWWCDDAGYR